MRTSQKNLPKFTEPTLKRLQSQWYIEYFSLENGNRGKQYRLTFNLNKIKNLQERELAAEKQINRLRSEFGYSISIIRNYQNTPILEAMTIALNIKVCSTEKIKTHQAYQDSYRVFKNFLEHNKIQEIPIQNFTKNLAVAFFDFVRSINTKFGTPYRAKTVNNHIRFVSGLFFELMRRDYLDVNPFSSIKNIKENDPIRRCFEQYEKEAVFAEIKKDPMLLLAHQLLYRCAIRPIEITRLKPKFFDFKNGIIKIPGAATKQNLQARIINISLDILPYLQRSIETIKPDWYIFGEGLKPNASKSCGRNILNLRHSKILRKLHQRGILEDITGLHFYSWKDNAAFDLIDAGIDINTLREHFGHADITTTQKYFKKKGIINQKIVNLKLDLNPE